MKYIQEELEILREGGRRLAIILDKVAKKAVEGTKVSELNDYAEKLISEEGDKPAFLNYKPYGADFPYPASLCVSVNDEIVHGISSGNGRVLKEGDIVGLDLGLNHKGLFTDMAVTVGIGKIDEKAQQLMEMTKKALQAGIDETRAGNRVGDIGYAIFNTAKHSGFGVVDELGGHGVGRKVHDEPFISNIGRKGKGEKLEVGMVLALEPMLNEGTKNIILAEDGHTFKTADGKRSSHFEHTVLITENGSEILTKF
ncbi:type I methionyl aminopeptidase [Patescibacteria group bacterium]|nr:type I methionyl aminopeptidase [Patescibacteria group bacterium]MCG2694657.1 type I methionyl aminopeptidase [Candidatus Parcubacteria bacterium]